MKYPVHTVGQLKLNTATIVLIKIKKVVPRKRSQFGEYQVICLTLFLGLWMVLYSFIHDHSLLLD